MKVTPLKFRPLGDRVAVCPIATKETTEGGLIIPEKSKAKVLTTTGTILAVGPGYVSNGVRLPLSCKVGDIVMYQADQWATVKIEGCDILILPEDALLGITHTYHDDELN
jgi:chaperonin GroES